MHPSVAEYQHLLTSRIKPATPALSAPIIPYACVPVLESPYKSRASAIFFRDLEGYNGYVAPVHASHASDSTQRSAEPVSIGLHKRDIGYNISSVRTKNEWSRNGAKLQQHVICSKYDLATHNMRYKNNVHIKSVA